MEHAYDILAIGSLLSIIGWLFQKILNQILSKIENIEKGITKLTEGQIKDRMTIKNLPCQIENRACLQLKKV